MDWNTWLWKLAEVMEYRANGFDDRQKASIRQSLEYGLNEFLRQHLEEHHGNETYVSWEDFSNHALAHLNEHHRPHRHVVYEPAQDPKHIRTNWTESNEVVDREAKPEVRECGAKWHDCFKHSHPSWKFCPHCGCDLKLKGGG